MKKGAVRVYKADVDRLNEFTENGWELFPIEASSRHIIIYKWIKLDKDDEPVKGLIGYYENGADRIPSHVKQFLYDMDIHYIEVEENGKKTKKLNLTDKCWETLLNWRLEIITDEVPALVRLMPADHTFPNPLYPVRWLKPCVEKFLKEEMDKGIVSYGFISE
jgi:hypothetical protein